MLLLCVSLWKDLSRDPMVIKRRLAGAVLDETVESGLEEHEGEVFQLHTRSVDNEPLDEPELVRIPATGHRPATGADGEGGAADPDASGEVGNGPSHRDEDTDRPKGDGRAPKA